MNMAQNRTDFTVSEISNNGTSDVIHLGNSPLLSYDIYNINYSSDDAFFNQSSSHGFDIIEHMAHDDIVAAIKSNLFRYQDVRVAVLIALYVIAFFVGFIGNFLVIFIFTKNRKMRTVTNSFLVNLAVCDLLVVCLCMPFSIASEVYYNWIYGLAWCKIVNFLQGLSVSSSIITLTVISAERFYAVNHPLKARAFMSKSRVLKIIVCIWIVSGLIVLPALVVRNETIFEQIYTVKILICLETWNSLVTKHVYNFTIVIILYILPVVFICIGYLKIGINLWRTDSNLHAGPTEGRSANRTLIGRRKVARMLFVMAIMFTLSWLPFQMTTLSIDFLPASMLVNGEMLRLVFSYTIWLGHANSSINPICYCIMSQSFKHAIRLEIVRCCHGKYIDSGKTTYYAPSMSLTMSTSGATTRSRITSCTRNGYKLVAHGNSRHGIKLNPVLQCKNGLLDVKRPPDLLKHISTNI